MFDIAIGCDKWKFSIARQDEWLATQFWDRFCQSVIQSALREEESDTRRQALLHVRKSVYHSGRKGKDTVRVFSWECTGIYAQYLWPLLPSWALAHLTYLHVKTYHESLNPDEYRELKNAATDGPMFRQITLFSPSKQRRDGGDVASLPGMRIGHAKSDRQVIIYQDGGQPFGIETRLSGDKLKTLVNAMTEAFRGEADNETEKMLSMLWTAQGEGFAYVSRLKEETGLSDKAVNGPIMTNEDLAAIWGKVSYPETLGRAGLFDSDGFPIEPVQGRTGPVKGRVNGKTGGEFRLTKPLDEVKEQG